MYVKCQKVGPAVRAHYLMYQSFKWKLVFIMSISCRPFIRTTTSRPHPHVFISTCFGSMKSFAYEYMIFSCLKSFKIANKGLIKNHSFQSWVASADSKSTWPGCTVKYYLLFFRLLCFIKLTLMAFRMKNIFLATSNFKFFNFTCRYVFSSFFFSGM